MQTRWTEAGAYQLLEVITTIQTICHPPGSCVSACLAAWSDQHSAARQPDQGTRQWTRRGESNRIAARCELSSLFWSMTFLSRLHSALFAWALSTWLISSTCSWVDGSCPEQERADKLSSVSSFPRPLLSPDTTYEVNFTLSSLILALISRCLCHILRPCGAPCLQEEHVRSPGMPTAAGPSDTDLSHHPLQYVRMLPLYRD